MGGSLGLKKGLHEASVNLGKPLMKKMVIYRGNNWDKL